MSLTLIERIKKARQSQVLVGKFSFTISRPTDLDAAFMGKYGMAVRELLAKNVVGWDNVTEQDLVSNGMPEAVPFDSDLFVEWAQDQPEIWNPIGKAVKEAYAAHQLKTEELTKN